MPSGRTPDSTAQRSYKTLLKRLIAFRAEYPEGYNRWIDGTIRGYEKRLDKLARQIESEGRTVPTPYGHRKRKG